MDVKVKIGLPWYVRATYARLRQVISDPERLPSSFDDWLLSAEAYEAHLQRLSLTPVRVIIDPDRFAWWCDARGLPYSADSRARYAGENIHEGQS